MGLSKRRNREEIMVLIEDYLSRDQSMEEYCKAERLNIETFKWWYYRYKREKGKQEIKPGSFIPLHRTVMQANKKIYSIEIEYQNGIRWRLESEFSIPLFKEISRYIEEV